MHVERSSGSGSYRLQTRLHQPTPTITGASPASGTSGDAVTLSGTDLGSDPTAISVRFAGVEAEITAAAGSSLAVVVPENAPDGDIIVCRPGGCSAGYAFTTGGTLPAGSYSPAAPTEWKGSPSGGAYTSRILFSITPNLASTDADDVMADAMASVTTLTSYAQVGFGPYGNDFQYSLAWDAAATLTDYATLTTTLDADARVDAVVPEGRVRLFDSLTPKHDVGFATSSVQDRFAAYDMDGVEETWRLLGTSYPLLQLQPVSVGVLDTGLRLDPSQEGTSQFQSASSTASGYYRYWALDGNVWDEAAVESDGVPAPSHGTAVASILGAADDRSPPLDDTTAATAGAGILAGVDQLGLDDDGDGNMDDADTDGERFPYELILMNGAPTGTWGAGRIYEAVKSLRAATASPDIFNFSFGMEKLPPGASMSWDEMLAGIPPGALVVIGSGNTNVGPGPATLEYRNVLALELAGSDVSTIIVASSDPGGATSTNDDGKLNTVTGAEVNIAAPGRAWALNDPVPVGTSAWTYKEGASYAAPQVTAAAALVMAVADSPSGSSYGMTAADARAIVLQHSVPIATFGWGSSMTRLDLFGSVLAAAEMADGIDKDVRVYAIDYSSQTLYSQIVDPQTGVFEGASADSASLAADCSAPTTITIDPRGDLLYVLCAESPASVLVVSALSLAVIDEVELAGSVSTATEIAVTPEGYVVASTESGGAAITEAWDPYDGSKILYQTTVASDVSEVTGMSAHPSQSLLAFATYDGDNGNMTGEQAAVLDLDVFGRTDSTDAAISTVQDFSAQTVDDIRDVEWNATDDTLACVFYTGSASYDELVELDSAGAVSTAETIASANEDWTIATNPSGNDELAYIGAYDLLQFAVVDLSLPGPYTPSAFWEYGTTDYPRLAEFAQNGKFVALGFQRSPTAAVPLLWTIPHDSAASGTMSVASDGDALSASITKLRGVAITPVMSVLSPRPGKEISGRRRVHVLVRDPDVQKLTYQLDGAAIGSCPDETALDDGIGDACLLDSKGWVDADDHELTVTAHNSDGSTFMVTARY